MAKIQLANISYLVLPPVILFGVKVRRQLTAGFEVGSRGRKQSPLLPREVALLST